MRPCRNLRSRRLQDNVLVMSCKSFYLPVAQTACMASQVPWSAPSLSALPMTKKIKQYNDERMAIHSLHPRGGGGWLSTGARLENTRCGGTPTLSSRYPYRSRGTAILSPIARGSARPLSDERYGSGGQASQQGARTQGAYYDIRRLRCRWHYSSITNL